MLRPHVLGRGTAGVARAVGLLGAPKHAAGAGVVAMGWLPAAAEAAQAANAPADQARKHATDAPNQKRYDFKEMFSKNYMGLPRLPIPDLGDTMTRWLASTQALHGGDAAAWANTKNAADAFLKGPGPELQKRLVASDEAQAAKGGYPYSYIERLWDDMYFGDRSIHPVYFSPFFKIIDADDMNPHRRAAAFTHGFMRWAIKVREGKFEEDLAGKAGLCTSSVGLMFNSAKVPGVERDELRQNPDAGHVAVLCRGSLFKIDLVDDNGAMITVEHLANLMEQCAASAAADAAHQKTTVAHLTTYERPKWAKARAAIETASPANAAALKAVDDALMVVCLDSEPIKSRGDMAMSLLIGEAGNRWYDKQQLIVAPSGEMGFCFEHSYSDGLGWARYIHEVMCDNMKIQVKPVGDTVAPLPQYPASTVLEGGQLNPSPIIIEQPYPADVSATIEDSVVAYEKMKALVGHKLCDFEDFGKRDIKTWGISPDAACQIAYQVAYHRIHNSMPAVYESCATRKFHHGRTETIRSSTPEMEAMVTAVEAALAGGSKDVAKEAVKKAAEQHVVVSKGAQNAQGVDRHLKALKDIADNDAGVDPAVKSAAAEFFSLPMVGRSATWDLSTSNASGSPFIDIFGFGAVSETGYGCGYLVFDDKIVINVTCYKGAGPVGALGVEPTADRMEAEIRRALHDVREVMLS